MFLAWTTVAQAADAERIAAGAIERGLAACVQVEGPVVSHYRWEGKQERTQEFRLMFKFVPSQLDALACYVQSAHPYDTPEWIVVHAAHVAEKYLSWANASSTTAPL